MVARVKLTVTQGRLNRKEFVFDERTKCVVGRAEDCALRLPGNLEFALVSRHHCLLDIDPPHVLVRDLGSLNGTYVNGRIIGRRSKEEAAEAGAAMPPAGCDLKDGDELGLGAIVFRVGIDGAKAAEVSPPAVPEDQHPSAPAG
jgi:pSer/pThr/pTyr-binding forkhead associated (FHA) protein